MAPTWHRYLNQMEMSKYICRSFEKCTHWANPNWERERLPKQSEVSQRELYCNWVPRLKWPPLKYIWLLWYIFQFCLVKVHVCKVYKVDLLQSSFRAFLTRCISAILSKQVKGQKTNQHYHLHPMIMITPHPSSHDHDHNFLQVGGVGFTAIRESQ